MNTNQTFESVEEAAPVALELSTHVDAFVFVLWTPQGFVTDIGPQNEQEAEDFIIDENEIEAVFCQGEKV